MAVAVVWHEGAGGCAVLDGAGGCGLSLAQSAGAQWGAGANDQGQPGAVGASESKVNTQDKSLSATGDKTTNSINQLNGEGKLWDLASKTQSH